jgi:hypothetical protein
MTKPRKQVKAPARRRAGRRRKPLVATGTRWTSLAPQGFPGYEISDHAEVRAIGSTVVRTTNAVGALSLRDADGVKFCKVAGAMCRVAFGPEAAGASVPRRKLTAAQVIEIRTRTDAPTLLAAEFGVSTSTIKAVRARKIHTDVGGEASAQYQQDRQALGTAA